MSEKVQLSLRNVPKEIVEDIQVIQIEIERRTKERPSQTDVTVPILQEGLEKKKLELGIPIN